MRDWPVPSSLSFTVLPSRRSGILIILIKTRDVAWLRQGIELHPQIDEVDLWVDPHDHDLIDLSQYSIVAVKTKLYLDDIHNAIRWGDTIDWGIRAIEGY
jgi:hypothetical protein